MGDFIAGGYTATYNAKALGQTAEGFFLSHEFFKRIITGDAGGDAPQDAIYRGRAQFVETELLEAIAAGIADLVEPYAATRGTPLTMGVIGQQDVGRSGCVGRAASLVLTAIAGTCAAATPASITMPLSMLAENYPVRVLYGPDLRRIPIRIRVYPNISTGVFGTVT